MHDALYPRNTPLHCKEVRKKEQFSIIHMKISQGKEMFLTIAAAMLLISIVLMILVIPAVYTKTLPNAYNKAAATGISMAILIRLLIFFWFISKIKKVRRGVEKSKTAYVLFGILLIIFGLIY